MSCGKPTPVTVVPVQVLSGQSPSALQDTPDSGPPAQALTFSAKAVPPISYLAPSAPLTTVGRSFPMWMRWIICCSSIEFPLSGSNPWSVWQSWQRPTSRRPPPCSASGSWQPLHCAVVVTSRTVVTAPPAGTKSNSGFAYRVCGSRVRST